MNGPGRRPICLVLGEGVTALGVIRSLGRAEIPLCAINNQRDISGWSRWNVTEPSSVDAGPEPGELPAWLSNLSIDEGVLMPCSDGWTKAVAELDDSTRSRFRTWVPDSDVVDCLVNKDRFRARMESLDLPHPRTFALDNAEQLQSVPAEILEHAFLKPHESQVFFAHYGVKGLFVRNAKDARERLDQVHRNGFGVVLQEYVPGPATSHYFIDGYRPIGSGGMRLLARRRLRMYPADFGNSTDMVTIPLNDVRPAISTLETLFDTIGYHGIFSAEFKHDERDNQFKLLEVNCRPWWYVDYADRCGLHVCKYAYQDALGLAIDPFESYKIGKRGVYPLFDWAARQENRKSGVREQSLVAMFINWLSGYQPIFAWNDPLPGIRTFARDLKNAIARRIH